MICEECGGTGEELVEHWGTTLVIQCGACLGTGEDLNLDETLEEFLEKNDTAGKASA